MVIHHQAYMPKLKAEKSVHGDPVSPIGLSTKFIQEGLCRIILTFHQLNMGVSLTQQSLTKQFKQSNALHVLSDYFKV